MTTSLQLLVVKLVYAVIAGLIGGLCFFLLSWQRRVVAEVPSPPAKSDKEDDAITILRLTTQRDEARAGRAEARAERNAARDARDEAERLLGEANLELIDQMIEVQRIREVARRQRRRRPAVVAVEAQSDGEEADEVFRIA